MANTDEKEEFFANCFKEQIEEKLLKDRGVEASTLYLERQGYEILEKTWSCDAGTVDLIAEEDNDLVLVEVKTRILCEDCGLPEEDVTKAKRDRYERIAAMYLKDYDSGDCRVRFDVVSVLVLAENRALIRHHVNAWGVGE